MGWDRPKPKRRTFKSSNYEYYPKMTFQSSDSFEYDIQELQYKIDELSYAASESRSLSIYGPPVYGPEDLYSGVKEQIDQFTLSSKKEESMLRSAQKDPVSFSYVFPEKYVEYLMDGKLEKPHQTLLVDNNNYIQIGENMNLGHLKYPETENSMREENARLKAELSLAEKELASLTKPPSWLSLLKEWFMYKVLKRSKPQPLYLGPYR